MSKQKAKPGSWGKNGRPPNCRRCRHPKTECSCGRPVFDGKDEKQVVAKLEEAYSIGATDREACYYADISRDMLWGYCKRNPEFFERRKLLKAKVPLLARKVVMEAITGNEKLGIRPDAKIASDIIRKNAGALEMDDLPDPADAGITEDQRDEIKVRVAAWNEKAVKGVKFYEPGEQPATK
jgi:hypothetical protein